MFEKPVEMLGSIKILQAVAVAVASVNTIVGFLIAPLSINFT